MNADTYDDWARWAAIEQEELGGGGPFGYVVTPRGRFPLAEVERRLDSLRSAHLPEGFNSEFTIPDTKKERGDA